MINYRFLDHTADIAVEVKGSSVEELFVSSALAWKQAAIEDFTPVKAEQKDISLSEDSLEELLVGFLSELNFLLSARKWVFHSFNELRITDQPGNSSIHLYASLNGEDLKMQNPGLKEEIKAITFHQMKIEKKDNEFFTIVVFDI